MPSQEKIEVVSGAAVADLEIFKGGVQATKGCEAAHSRGVWGHAPPGNFVILMLIKWIVKHLGHILVV